MGNKYHILLADANKQLQADQIVYLESVEKEAYCKLGKLRSQQEKIFLTLQTAHNEVITKMFVYDDICRICQEGKRKLCLTELISSTVLVVGVLAMVIEQVISINKFEFLLFKVYD